MKTKRLSTPYTSRFIFPLILFVLTGTTRAQQFNSDSWLSKPHGTITLIPTIGQRNSMIMNTFSLFPRWEFTFAAYMYNDDNDPLTDDGYSASLYLKYMFYENKAKTGGASVKAGTGMFPGTIQGQDREKDAFQSYWMNVPCTIPFFDNKVSWDLMPGASVTKNYGQTETTEWAFTYSTRVAWNPFSPKWSIVGEVFGTEGGVTAIPEYKLGIRYEPNQYGVFCLSYGQEFNGTNGAGFELGVMLYTPPFAYFGNRKKNKQKNQ